MTAPLTVTGRHTTQVAVARGAVMALDRILFDGATPTQAQMEQALDAAKALEAAGCALRRALRKAGA